MYWRINFKKKYVMKKSIAILIVFNAIALSIFSQKTINPYDGALEITSSALFNDEKTSNYSISVFLDGHRLDSVFMKNKRPIHMYLDYNKVYTFLFQKDNCKEKIVVLNTQIPKGLKGMQDESFVFQVEMTQGLTKNSAETEDLPVAVVMINQSDEILEASEKYYKMTHNSETTDRSATNTEIDGKDKK